MGLLFYNIIASTPECNAYGIEQGEENSDLKMNFFYFRYFLCSWVVAFSDGYVGCT
jgi:hypothetical protein